MGAPGSERADVRLGGGFCTSDAGTPWHKGLMIPCARLFWKKQVDASTPPVVALSDVRAW